jgi:hypothetical protein
MNDNLRAILHGLLVGASMLVAVGSILYVVCIWESQAEQRRRWEHSMYRCVAVDKMSLDLCKEIYGAKP